MAVTTVQSKPFGVAGPNPTVTFTSNNTAGNMLVLGMRVGAAVAIPTITDTQLNVWKHVSWNSAAGNIAMFYCQSCKAGVNTVTVNTTSNNCSGVVLEISGLPSNVVPTVALIATGTGTSAPTGNITPLSDNNYIFAYLGNNGVNNAVITAGTPFVKENGAPSSGSANGCAADLAQGTAASVGCTFTINSSQPWATIIAAFGPPPAFTFTQLMSSTFAGANENPLSEGGNWQANTNGTVLKPEKLVSHQAVQVTPSSSTIGKAWWVGGPSLNGNQYCDITLGATSDVNSFMRTQICGTNTVDTDYGIAVEGPYGASAILFLLKRTAGAQVVFNEVLTTVNAGDVIRIAKFGSYIFGYRNGVFVPGLGTTDSSFSSGIPSIATQSATSTFGVVGFAAGNVFSGVPNQLMMMGAGT